MSQVELCTEWYKVTNNQRPDFLNESAEGFGKVSWNSLGLSTRSWHSMFAYCTDCLFRTHLTLLIVQHMHGLSS